MAKQQIKDMYSNYILAEVEESGANTLTFEELPQITTLLEKKAFLINRVDYDLPLNLLIAGGDTIEYGLSLSNKWTDPELTEATIVNYNKHRTVEIGTGASGFDYDSTVSRDFSTLPGGGILIPTRPLYLFVLGTNLGGPATVGMKLYFTVIELDPSQYWDLVESLQAYS